MKLDKELKSKIEYATIGICGRLQMATPLLILDRKEFLQLGTVFRNQCKNKFMAFHISYIKKYKNLGYAIPKANVIFIDVNGINRKQLKLHSKALEKQTGEKRKIKAKELLAQILSHELCHLRYPSLLHGQRFQDVTRAIFKGKSLKYIESIAGTVKRHTI